MYEAAATDSSSSLHRIAVQFDRTSMTAPRIVLFCVTMSVVGCGSGGPQTDTVVSQDELAVAINYPLDSAEFISPNVVAIFVDASDTSGAVNRIEFYANGALLGSDTSEPFGYRWMSPPLGTYDLTAVAYDLSL